MTFVAGDGIVTVENRLIAVEAAISFRELDGIQVCCWMGAPKSTPLDGITVEDFRDEGSRFTLGA